MIHPAPVIEEHGGILVVRDAFPSCGNYDAKAWRFITAQASPGALFWNVAA